MTHAVVHRTHAHARERVRTHTVSTDEEQRSVSRGSNSERSVRTWAHLNSDLVWVVPASQHKVTLQGEARKRSITRHVPISNASEAMLTHRQASPILVVLVVAGR